MTDTVLAAVYLTAFQLCAVPQIYRLWKRQSSGDVSIYRELLVMFGCGVQLIVMCRTGAAWQVIVSPLATMASVSLLLFVILKYRTAAP